MNSKTRFPLAFACLLLTLLVMPINNSADTQLVASPALQTILDQAEATYMTPFGGSKQWGLNEQPGLYALFVGLTLQRQFNYLPDNTEYIPHFQDLRKEALVFMEQLASAHNFRHPTDGTELSASFMRSELHRGLNSDSNDKYIQTMGIDPANVELPLMLSQVPEPKRTEKIEDRARLQLKEEPEGITLLEEKAGPAKVVDPKTIKTENVQGQNLTGLICPMRKPPDPNRQLYWLSHGSFRIPNNGVMNDKKNIQCSYSNDGRISSQTGHAQGEVVTIFYFGYRGGPVYQLTSRLEEIDDDKPGVRYHGITEKYWISKNGQPYLKERGQWRNGKKHGTEQWFEELPSGKIYLKMVIQYVDGMKHGPQLYYSFDKKTEKVYLGTENIWAQSSIEKTTLYNPDGSVKH